MPAKVLVTGGAGFIGYHLARSLAEEGQEVVVIDDLSRGEADEEFQQLCRLPNVTFHQADLTQPEALDGLGSFDHVYHLAAINGTRYFYEIPHLVLRVNLLTTIHLLAWFAAGGGKRLLIASSSEAYSGTRSTIGIPLPTPEDVPLTIADPYNPRFSYAASKIAAELLGLHYGRAYGKPVIIARYHNIYGPRMGFEHVIPAFCQRILQRENPFPIFGHQERRSFCYVDDAIEASKLLLGQPSIESQVVNIGSGDEDITMRQLAERMFDLFDFHPRLDLRPAPEGSVDRRWPDISRLKALTGFQTQIDLDEGLRRTFAWYQRHDSNQPTEEHANG